MSKLVVLESAVDVDSNGYGFGQVQPALLASMLRRIAAAIDSGNVVITDVEQRTVVAVDDFLKYRFAITYCERQSET